MSWFQDINQRGILATAKALGLEVTENPLAFGPCPSCSNKTRHTKRKDKRLACIIVHGGFGFQCLQCGVTGDSVNLLALAVNRGKRPTSTEEWRRVREEAERGIIPKIAIYPVKPNVEQFKRPPFKEVMELWHSSAAMPVSRNDVDEFLKEKFPSYTKDEILSAGVARFIPRTGSRPDWWPWRNRDYMAVLAFDGLGYVQSIHARIMVPKHLAGDEPKTRFPKGYSASGLVLANKTAVSWLRKKRSVQTVLITEGLTSMMAATMFTRKTGRWDWAIISVMSGSASAFKDMTFDKEKVLIWTDSDKPGDDYANRIAQALPSYVNPSRVRL